VLTEKSNATCRVKKRRSAMSDEALVISDMLNDFVREGAPLEVPDTRKIIPVIQDEIRRAREKGNPVIYVCDAHDEDDREFSRFGWPAHAVRGSDGAAVVSELAPDKNDVIVRKKTYSGFHETTLDETLKGLGIKRLRLTGCVTHICVLFIAAEAVLRGYHVTVPKNGVAGIAKEDHDAALRIMKNVLGVIIE
jgi:nicotinamidase-related amidase